MQWATFLFQTLETVHLQESVTPICLQLTSQALSTSIGLKLHADVALMSKRDR